MRAQVVTLTLTVGLVAAACGAPAAVPSASPEADPTVVATGKPTTRPTAKPLPVLEAAVTIPVPAPILAVVTNDAVFIQTADAVVEIDPFTNQTRVVVDGQGERWSVGAGFGSLWTTHDGGEGIPAWGERIDIATGATLATYEVGVLGLDPIAADGAIWVPNHHSSSVSRIDPATNTVTAIPVEGRFDPTLLAAGDGRVWANSPHGATLTAIDTASREVAMQVVVSGLFCGVGYHVDRVFLIPCNRGTTYVYDPLSGAEVATFEGAPATDGTTLYGLYLTGDGDAFRFARHDPDTLELQEAVRVEALPGGAAIGFSSLWVMGQDVVMRVPLAGLRS